MPHLCKYMPQPKNARRLVPDPENEPDFYQLSKLFPLPDEKGKPQARVAAKKSPVVVDLVEVAPEVVDSNAAVALSLQEQANAVRAAAATEVRLVPLREAAFALGGAGLGRGVARLPRRISAATLPAPTLGGLTTPQLLRRQQLLSQAAAIEQNALLSAIGLGSGSTVLLQLPPHSRPAARRSDNWHF